jgi:halimadienyl-diphosphate synthase
VTVEACTTPVDVGAAARQLVADLALDPWGSVSPSAYETGRLVVIAPWLDGHRQRIDYLLATQRADGGWGGPGAYAMVPTLSATEALLAAADGADAAADRGLRALGGWLREPGPAIPDMPAIELIVPALTASINERLDQLGRPRLPVPQAIGGATLERIRAFLAAGGAPPEKLLHAWEVVGSLPAHALDAGASGPVGGSPAATAAWLRDRGGSEPAWRYLAQAARHQEGPVPCAAPITVFEHAWVLNWLAEAGIPVEVPERLLRDLDAAVGPHGAAAGPGLPLDADTTAVALSALTQFGMPREPDSLWAYELPSHFCTWQGEDGQSVSVNAHVLEAFGHYLGTGPGRAEPYEAAMRRLSAWLVARQDPDGSWSDRWHASPFYATACCALALARFGHGAAAADAVGRAVDWVLSTQRPDGSWGLWQATGEETAYAMRILLTGTGGRAERAIAKGYIHLSRAVQADPVIGTGDPPMWHDKDLYSPVAIIRAAVLAALHQAQRLFS